MENPFESGHIKNYVLLYASVVVIMVLFFIAATLFNDVQDLEQKVFSTDMQEKPLSEDLKVEVVEEKTRFKLMDKAY